MLSQINVPKLVPIFKNGEQQSASNYRPISLLSAFSKVFEKAIYSQIVHFLDAHSILSETQFGF